MSQIPTFTAPASPPAVTPSLMTADEFMRRHAHENVELVNGVVRVPPPTFFRQGKACVALAAEIANFAVARDLGHVASNDSFVQTTSDPDTIRGADVCFFSYTRLQRGPVPEGLLSVVPELIAEVHSPLVRWLDTFVKVVEYLRAGVSVVLLLDSPTATVSAFRDTEPPRTFQANENLTIPDLLPGFSVRVEHLFR